MFLLVVNGIKSAALKYFIFHDFSSKCQFSLTQNKIRWFFHDLEEFSFPDLWQPWCHHTYWQLTFLAWKKSSIRHTVSNNSSIKLSPKWQFCSSTQPPSFINCANRRRACTSCPCPMEMARQSVRDTKTITTVKQLSPWPTSSNNCHIMLIFKLTREKCAQILDIYQVYFRKEQVHNQFKWQRYPRFRRKSVGNSLGQ